MRNLRVWIAGLIVLSSWASAQTPARAPGRIVSAGYTPPARIQVAPGQVITLFVHSPAGTQPDRAVNAETLPLPTSLNNYTVTLEQTFSTAPIPVPLFAVYPLDNCFGLNPVCEDLTAITIQIPWELVPNRERGGGRPENFAKLTVAFQGVPGESIAIEPQLDNIHIVNSCDSTMPPGIERPADMSGPCRPLVTHVDGRLVTSANPASQGETLVLYAFGLGASGGGVRSGDTTRAPVPLTDVGVVFQSGVNLQASRPGPIPPQTGNSPLALYAGLTAGQVGLYQIAVTLPNLPANTPACTASSIQSNFTISIGRTATFDGAGICIQP